MFFFFFSSIIFWEIYFGCGYIIMGKKTESEVGPRYLGETRDSLFLTRIAQIDNVSILHPTFLVKNELKMY